MKAEEDLRSTRADIKLVEEENLHFTVKFLGEIPEGLVVEIDKRINALTLKKVDVSVAGLGAFPDVGRPRVVWAGVDPKDAGALGRTGEEVFHALEGVGQKDERGFHPHITLARVRSPRNLEVLSAKIREHSETVFGRTAITSLKLKSSSLSPSGPTYADVREYALA